MLPLHKKQWWRKVPQMMIECVHFQGRQQQAVSFDRCRKFVHEEDAEVQLLLKIFSE
jgi:hypothetical protein